MKNQKSNLVDGLIVFKGKFIVDISHACVFQEIDGELYKLTF